jgi:hypothetical protein
LKLKKVIIKIKPKIPFSKKTSTNKLELAAVNKPSFLKTENPKPFPNINS